MHDLTRWLLGWICGKSVAQSAQTAVHAALAPIPRETLNGSFMSDCRLTSMWVNSQIEDETMCQELWKETSYLLKLRDSI